MPTAPGCEHSGDVGRQEGSVLRIGYRTAGLRGLSFRQKLELARRLDLSAIEVVAAKEFENEDPARVRALAEEMDVTISAVSGGMNLCVPERMEEARGLCQDALELCNALGTEVLFKRTMWPEPGVPEAETWAHLIGATRDIAEMSAGAGVKFAIEADPPCFVSSLERVERLLDAVDHENLHVNYDPTNFYLAGSDPLLVIERLGDRMVNGHIKDGVYQTDRKQETAIGEGEVPYTQVFAALQSAGIDIAMNIEHCKTVECVTSAAAFVHGVLASL